MKMTLSLEGNENFKIQFLILLLSFLMGLYKIYKILWNYKVKKLIQILFGNYIC